MYDKIVVDEIHKRIDIVQFIKRDVKLKKEGRTYKGLCPFHNELDPKTGKFVREKTPSFMVDPEKQLFHCFGCDRGGNVFNYLMEKEVCKFEEACKKLIKEVKRELREE